MSTSIQLYTLLEKTSSFFSFFKFATESKKNLGERFDAYGISPFFAELPLEKSDGSRQEIEEQEHDESHGYCIE